MRFMQMLSVSSPLWFLLGGFLLVTEALPLPAAQLGESESLYYPEYYGALTRESCETFTWAEKRRAPELRLFLQVAPTGGSCCDLSQ
jgi:hypothetical protein